jgi:hypothetical protein
MQQHHNGLAQRIFRRWSNWRGGRRNWRICDLLGHGLRGRLTADNYAPVSGDNRTQQENYRKDHGETTAHKGFPYAMRNNLETPKKTSQSGSYEHSLIRNRR